jgi:hypothetical protein
MEEFALIRGIWASNPAFIGAFRQDSIYLGLRRTTGYNFVTDNGKNFQKL